MKGRTSCKDESRSKRHFLPEREGVVTGGRKCAPRNSQHSQYSHARAQVPVIAGLARHTVYWSSDVRGTVLSASGIYSFNPDNNPEEAGVLPLVDVEIEAKKNGVLCYSDIFGEWQPWDLNTEPKLLAQTLDCS